MLGWKRSRRDQMTSRGGPPLRNGDVAARRRPKVRQRTTSGEKKKTRDGSAGDEANAAAQRMSRQSASGARRGVAHASAGEGDHRGGGERARPAWRRQAWSRPSAGDRGGGEGAAQGGVCHADVRVVRGVYSPLPSPKNTGRAVSRAAGAVAPARWRAVVGTSAAASPRGQLGGGGAAPPVQKPPPHVGARWKGLPEPGMTVVGGQTDCRVEGCAHPQNALAPDACNVSLGGATSLAAAATDGGWRPHASPRGRRHWLADERPRVYSACRAGTYKEAKLESSRGTRRYLMRWPKVYGHNRWCERLSSFGTHQPPQFRPL